MFYGENEAEYGNPVADADKAQRAIEFYTATDPLDLTISGVSVRAEYLR